ncbi:type II secretion system F family protein [Massilia sp. W12]|uniref:type II secretion system F family protein n=1 Tax=Massilia sp. W12 TaxID=3126507 RepID=UPI0030CCB3A7
MQLQPEQSRDYHLDVQGAGGARQRLCVQAVNEVEAIRAAARNGWQVLAIDLPPQEARTRRGQFPLLQFSQELLTLLEAGLNLHEALTTLHNKESRSSARATLAAMLLSLQHGKNFSDTLAAFPAIFPDIYVASMRAAERSGDLPQSLARYVSYQLQFETIRRKLIAAAVYPALLLAMGALVTLFLLVYVTPKFAVVYESSGRDIPLLSQWLLSFGRLLAGHGWLMSALGLGLLLLLFWLLRQAAVRARLLNLALDLPLLATRSAEFRLARFYRALSLLLHAGIPLTRGMQMAGPLLQPGQQSRLALARRAVEEGQTFSLALEAHELATAVAQSLLKVGENTGRLAEMLERSARFHDEEFARQIELASRLLEPLLMAVIGVVIGSVVVLMYLPIFELAGSL